MSPVIERILKGDLPEHAMEAVVKGILPMESEELLFAIYLICSKEESYLATGRETIQGLPDGAKKSFFENRNIEAGIIDFYLKNVPLPLETKTVVLLNPGTKGESIAAVAEDLEPELLDLVVNNQVKILEAPSIIDGLRENPYLTINQKQRLSEYERLLLKSKIAPAELLEEKEIEDIEAEAIADAKEFVAAFGKEAGGVVRSAGLPPASASAAEPQEDPVAQVDGAPAATSAPKIEAKERLSVLEQIAGMSIPQKVQAAIKGDREVRSILIRDANKLVCCAVIKSPRITDSEVEFYANLRNVQTDVLRLIAQNREWTKSYKVVHCLVKNPRTPLAFSTKLLSRLNKKDLKNLIKDRGVPEVLRTMSRRMSQVPQ